jgi:hypothetical protein
MSPKTVTSHTGKKYSQILSMIQVHLVESRRKNDGAPVRPDRFELFHLPKLAASAALANSR